jgi:hypothetical protein
MAKNMNQLTGITPVFAYHRALIATLVKKDLLRRVD